MIKKILASLVVLIVAAAAVGLILPRHTRVERSVVIDRPASLIFATVNSFQLFPMWSPWQDLDPNMHQFAEGPRDGVGAKLVWSGNDKVGSGTQLITGSTPDRSVASDLDFGSMGIAKSLLTLVPDGPTTRVTWTLDVDMGANPIGHYIGLTMDRMIGPDFGRGLSKLKTLLESMPNVDIAGFNAQEVQMVPAPILLVAETSTAAPNAIANAYMDGFTKIAKFMSKRKLHQKGAPLGIDGTTTPASYSFDAGIPVDRGDVASADGVRVTQSYAGKALKTIHIGPYDGLPKTYQKLGTYIVVHGYVQNGTTFSSFIDDPGSVPLETLRTEVYAPIK
jgi:effector-binding domain-containing protein